jgi:putative tryptophan/tyrosine transport system substrate-binding protein
LEQALMRPVPGGWVRDLAGLVAAAAFALSAAAVEPAKPYRIGVINEAWAVNHPTLDGLKEGLRELGLLEGRDVVYDVHFTRGKPGAADAAAANLVKAGVDLVFTSNEAPALAAKKATQRIPVVFTLVGDPVAIGLVDKLAYPGGNLTGISSRATDLAPKRLEILKELVPGLRRVWFIYYSGDITEATAHRNLNDAAHRLGVALLPRPVNDAGTLKAALKEIAPGDGILSPSSNTLDIPVAVLETQISSRVPAIYPSGIWTSHGALISYGPDFRAQGVQAARLVIKLLRGVKPADVPVEGAENIDLAFNVKMIGLLGLTIPPKILFGANAVYR